MICCRNVLTLCHNITQRFPTRSARSWTIRTDYKSTQSGLMNQSVLVFIFLLRCFNLFCWCSFNVTKTGIHQYVYCLASYSAMWYDGWTNECGEQWEFRWVFFSSFEPRNSIHTACRSNRHFHASNGLVYESFFIFFVLIGAHLALSNCFCCCCLFSLCVLSCFAMFNRQFCLFFWADFLVFIFGALKFSILSTIARMSMLEWKSLFPVWFHVKHEENPKLLYHIRCVHRIDRSKCVNMKNFNWIAHNLKIAFDRCEQPVVGLSVSSWRCRRFNVTNS